MVMLLLVVVVVVFVMVGLEALKGRVQAHAGVAGRVMHVRKVVCARTGDLRVCGGEGVGVEGRVVVVSYEG